jgi:hypothetical protein
MQKASKLWLRGARDVNMYDVVVATLKISDTLGGSQIDQTFDIHDKARRNVGRLVGSVCR